MTKALVAKQQAGGPPTVASLRQVLRAATTPTQALDIATLAARAKKVYEAIGLSVEECNEYAEVYLSAYWKFGYLVEGVPPHRPEKGAMDGPLPGTKRQRKYARALRGAITEADIPSYVKVATEQLEAASIAGCLEWIDPGRHGNLKGDYEWYTPTAIIEAARAVMGGGIDLDPASCDHANDIVRATEYFTEVDDGLAHEWHGRVFLNPPFAHPTVQFFAEKLLQSPDVDQAVWLSNACVDTAWWQALAAKGVVCCHLGRVKFYGPEGQLQPPTLGQTIIYLGPQREQFRAAFTSFGVVLA
jgi:hypothetical protein